MIKSLTTLGNSKALVIEKAMFQITIKPNGGIVIQSVKKNDETFHNKKVKEIIKKHSKL